MRGSFSSEERDTSVGFSVIKCVMVDEGKPLACIIPWAENYEPWHKAAEGARWATSVNKIPH